MAIHRPTVKAELSNHALPTASLAISHAGYILMIDPPGSCASAPLAAFDLAIGGIDAHAIGEAATRPGLGDRHAAVVEHDQELALERAGVVEVSMATPLTMEASISETIRRPWD